MWSPEQLGNRTQMLDEDPFAIDDDGVASAQAATLEVRAITDSHPGQFRSSIIVLSVSAIVTDDNGYRGCASDPRCGRAGSKRGAHVAQHSGQHCAEQIQHQLLR